MKEQDMLMICESSGKIVNQTVEGDSIVLEGIFAEFGVLNNNDRIYEEDQYLPHMERLNSVITTTKLLGELDHPNNFDITLGNVSHCIESLRYDKETRTIKGKIRILPTAKGKEAEALIKAGIPLSISSRAAGKVNESTRKVEINHIVTYDLVAVPGFPKATLQQIYESNGWKYNGGEYAGKKLLNEELGIKSDNLFIYSINEKQQNQDRYIKEDNNKNRTAMVNEKNSNSNNYVNMEQMNKYSQHISQEWKSINEKLESLKSQIGDNGNSLEIQAEIEKNNIAIQSLNEKINKVINYCEVIAKESNDKELIIKENQREINSLKNTSSQMEKYLEYFSKTANESHSNIVGYFDVLSETLNESLNYSDMLAEKLNQHEESKDMIMESFGNFALYVKDYLAGEVMENLIELNDLNAEKMNELAGYTEYLSENLEKTISYADNIAEGLNSHIDYSQEVLLEGVDNSIKYTEFIAENVLPKVPQGNLQENDHVLNKLENISMLLENQKSNGVNNMAYQTKAMAFLSESNRNAFLTLPIIEKEKVIKALNESDVYCENDVLNVWHQTIYGKNDARPFITHMPEDVKKVWENMTNPQRLVYELRAKQVDLSTPYKVKMFWVNQNLVQGKSPNSMIKESFENSQLGKIIKEGYEKNPTLVKFGVDTEQLNNAKEFFKKRYKN